MPTPSAHNDTFESLLKLIPAKYYLPRANRRTGRLQIPKTQQEAKGAEAGHQGGVQEGKAGKGVLLSERTKLSSINTTHSSTQTTTKPCSTCKMNPRGKASGKRSTTTRTWRWMSTSISGTMIPTTTGSDAEEDDGDGDGDGDGDAMEDIVPMPSSGGIEALRDKLHARMAALRRGGVRSGADALLDERLQRAAMRERRRKETKEKIRREEEAKGKGKGKGTDKDKAKERADNRDKGNITQTQLLSQSKLKTNSNPTQALAQIASRKEKLAALPEEKRKAIEEREKWDKAAARLEGVKRKEKEKGRSKRDWDERKEQISASFAAKQKKRTDNIAMRNEKRKGGAAGPRAREGAAWVRGQVVRQGRQGQGGRRRGEEVVLCFLSPLLFFARLIVCLPLFLIW
ncbi:hypothetical protein B0H14DRAFT_3114667, partial [Mycena olivaceomarginata]